MFETDLRLTTKGLEDAASVYHGHEFRFIVGKDMKEYRCWLFQACFVIVFEVGTEKNGRKLEKMTKIYSKSG